MLKAALFIAVADLILSAALFALVPYWAPAHALELLLTCLLTALVAVAFLRHGRPHHNRKTP